MAKLCSYRLECSLEGEPKTTMTEVIILGWN